MANWKAFDVLGEISCCFYQAIPNATAAKKKVKLSMQVTRQHNTTFTRNVLHLIAILPEISSLVSWEGPICMCSISYGICTAVETTVAIQNWLVIRIERIESEKTSIDLLIIICRWLDRIIYIFVQCQTGDTWQWMRMSRMIVIGLNLRAWGDFFSCHRFRLNFRELTKSLFSKVLKWVSKQPHFWCFCMIRRFQL